MKRYQKNIFSILALVWLFLLIENRLPALFLLVFTTLSLLEFFWVLLPRTKKMNFLSLLERENWQLDRKLLMTLLILCWLFVIIFGFADVTTNDRRLQIAMLVVKIIFAAEWSISVIAGRLNGVSGNVAQAD